MINYISKSHKYQFGNIKHSWIRASPQGGAGDGTVRAIVRDHHQLLLPSKLKDWAKSVSAIQDADIRQEFFRIQSEFAEIIHQNVIHTSGQFYLRYQPSNSEIDEMLQMQGDNDRDFMTITTDGGFIHAPVRWVESKVVMCSSETLIGSCCN